MPESAAERLRYHLNELKIALDANDPRHSLPIVPPGSKRILDVGCGIGQTLAALNLADDVEAHGVDIDTDAIEFGQGRFPKLHLQVSGGEDLPFEDASFDFLFCRVSLAYMHIPTALSEFNRVLRDQATLWITTHPLAMLGTDVRNAARAKSARALVFRGYTSSIPGAVGRNGIRYPSTDAMESTKRGCAAGARPRGFSMALRKNREPSNGPSTT